MLSFQWLFIFVKILYIMCGKLVAVLFLSHLFISNAIAQSSSEILLNMKKLEKTGAVLYIAAHPDDENTRLLAYLANERKVRTGYLSLTRGDGGQNLIGDEQGVALGVIRTHELMQARSIDRAEQFFTRAYDFGYSKNPEETFQFWNRDSILADVVWVIRNFKPDVIICRFPTTGEGGHGHHTASAMLAEDAFEAAADPTKFSWQLQYTDVWKAKRLFWNTFNFGGNNTTAEDQLKIDVGTYNQLLGRSYGEIASMSRSMHKSQGFGSASQRGVNFEYFKHMKGEVAEKDILDDVDVNWTRIAQSNGIVSSINDLIYQFKPDAPELSIPVLLQIKKLIGDLPNAPSSVVYWKQKKTTEIDELILACAGVFVEALAPDFTAVNGDEIEITNAFIMRNNASVMIKNVSFFQYGDTLLDAKLNFNELKTFKKKIKIQSDKTSIPYWLLNNNSLGEFKIDNLLAIGKPLNDAALEVNYTFEIMGEPIEYSVPVRYKYTDPVRGELYRSFDILPAYSITPKLGTLVFNQRSTKRIFCTVRAFQPGTVQLKADAPDGWQYDFSESTLTFTKKGEEKTVELSVTPSGDVKDGFIVPYVEQEGKRFNLSVKYLDYEHIPNPLLTTEAKIKLTLVDLKMEKKNIGYIEGAGDLVDESLAAVGYNVTYLVEEDLVNADLKKFDAIITGVRAYNTNEKLANFQPRLLEYVKDGGNLIIQYNTNNRIGPLNFNVGPYPFTISRNRVTDEHSPYQIINAKDELWNSPNIIGEKDFENWIQERGIYFAVDADKSYVKPLKLKDGTEDFQDGGLIYSRHGKGYFVYTGLAFFRQLPAGVPGAYRIMANVIDLGK